MTSLRDRHAAHRAACAEAVAEIAKHDLPLAKSAARVLGVSMPDCHTPPETEAEARARVARGVADLLDPSTVAEQLGGGNG